jgi:hypothetical protein
MKIERSIHIMIELLKVEMEKIKKDSVAKKPNFFLIRPKKIKVFQATEKFIDVSLFM